MSATLKSILLGIGLGSFPLWGSAILYYGIPLIVTDNPGSLLSFAVLLFYILSFIGVFIICLIFTIREKSLMGKIGIPMLLLQAVAVYYIFSMIE